MGYYVKSVVPVIESNYDKFTTVEKTIADFFIQNKEKSDFSVKAVSERLFVSKASPRNVVIMAIKNLFISMKIR